MRDVGGRAPPFRDRPRRGRRGELGDGVRGGGQTRVERRQGGVQELRVPGEDLLGPVEVTLPDAGFLTCTDMLKRLEKSRKSRFEY